MFGCGAAMLVLTSSNARAVAQRQVTQKKSLLQLEIFGADEFFAVSPAVFFTRFPVLPILGGG